jgi:hypothetical protein
MTTKENGAGAAGAKEAVRLRRQLQVLTERANAGDRQALAELRQLLDSHPEIEQHVGDLARLAEAAWIEHVVGKDTLVNESVKRQVAELKRNLSGERPTTLETLVVDLVGINYLAERHAEITAAADTTSLQEAVFRLKRSESVQRRYLSSLKLLANLRALLPQGLAPEGTLRLFDPERESA